MEFVDRHRAALFLDRILDCRLYLFRAPEVPRAAMAGPDLRARPAVASGAQRARGVCLERIEHRLRLRAAVDHEMHMSGADVRRVQEPASNPAGCHQ